VTFPKQAMILAAGRGTRLGPLGERRAKALLDIDGRPLLEHQLGYLGGQGVERAVVNASHLSGQVEEFAEAHRGPPELEVIVEPEALGTAGGVINALSLFSGEPILILYGDVVAGEALAPMAALHVRHRPVATLAAYHSDRAQQKGVLELRDSLVVGFHEKDPDRTSGWVNAGIYIVEPGWLSSFPRDGALDFGFDLFPAALASGDELRAHRLGGPMLDIGTPEDLARARDRGLPEAHAKHGRGGSA
jgi:NDP-sugar pyrophosphorylase family protein